MHDEATGPASGVDQPAESRFLEAGSGHLHCAVNRLGDDQIGIAETEMVPAVLLVAGALRSDGCEEVSLSGAQSRPVLVLLGARHIEEWDRREVVQLKGRKRLEPSAPAAGLVAFDLFIEPTWAERYFSSHPANCFLRLVLL